MLKFKSYYELVDSFTGNVVKKVISDDISFFKLAASILKINGKKRLVIAYIDSDSRNF